LGGGNKMRQPRTRLQPHRLMFIDQATTNTTRLGGRCGKRQHLPDSPERQVLTPYGDLAANHNSARAVARLMVVRSRLCEVGLVGHAESLDMYLPKRIIPGTFEEGQRSKAVPSDCIAARTSPQVILLTSWRAMSAVAPLAVINSGRIMNSRLMEELLGLGGSPQDVERSPVQWTWRLRPKGTGGH
jgi:hypothetical protein